MGRKKRYTKLVNFYMTNELYDRVVCLSDKEALDTSATLRLCIKKYLDGLGIDGI